VLNPDFKDMLSVFNAESVEYLIVGAYAMAAHGVPRATGDLDCWIRRSPENAERVMRALAAFGAPLERISKDDLSVPGLVLQFGVEPTRIDLLTSIDGVDFDEAYQRRLVARIDDIEVSLLDLETLIRNKRAVGRPRDLADVARLEALAMRLKTKGR
jgi:hypothetical protein